MPNTITCTRCTHSFDVGDPVIEIVNQISFCSIVVNFAGVPRKCVRCGQEYFLAIQALDMRGIKIACLPVPVQPEESRIITLPH